MYNDYGKLNSLFKGPDFTRHSKVLRDRHWIVNLAPEPEDIVWSVSCLNITYLQTYMQQTSNFGFRLSIDLYIFMHTSLSYHLYVRNRTWVWENGRSVFECFT